MTHFLLYGECFYPLFHIWHTLLVFEQFSSFWVSFMLCLKLTTESPKTLPFSNNSNHQCKYITYFFIISKWFTCVRCFFLRRIQFSWMDNTLYSFLLIPQYITLDKPEHKIIFMCWIIYTKVYIEVHMYWGQKPISDALYQKDSNLFAPWWKERVFRWLSL